MSSLRTGVEIRSLQESDVAAGDLIVKVAFGTQLHYPEPEKFHADTSLKGRFLAEPEGAFGAYRGGELVGLVYTYTWGTVAIFGPIAVKPQLWGEGIAQLLLDRVMQYFATKQITHAGLATFPDSTKHIGLYRKYGYRPRFLIAMVTRPIDHVGTSDQSEGWTTFSKLSSSDQQKVLKETSEITNSIYPGLEVRKEIEAVNQLAIGDTVILPGSNQAQGFAICHYGVGSEADGSACYIRFAAVAPGPAASSNFQKLIASCAAYARSRNASKLFGGVNTAREEAYESLLSQGFKMEGASIAMHKPNEPGYSRPGVFIMDDWR
jgi:GNAT superfamily N-acetyltransferase